MIYWYCCTILGSLQLFDRYATLSLDMFGLDMSFVAYTRSFIGIRSRVFLLLHRKYIYLINNFLEALTNFFHFILDGGFSQIYIYSFMDLFQASYKNKLRWKTTLSVMCLKPLSSTWKGKALILSWILFAKFHNSWLKLEMRNWGSEISILQ